MKRIFSLTTVVAAVGAVCAAVPRLVDNSVAWRQRGETVTITYTLADAPGIVTAEVFTNGVPLADADLAGLEGDVNALVQTGARTITWNPGRTWRDDVVFKNGEVGVKLTVRAETMPPDYMVVDLATGATKYYVSSNAVPGGVQDDRYKTTKLLMRKIPAANRIWRMGDAPILGTGTNNSVTRPRLVTLTYDYWIGVFPLTHEQVKSITGSYAGNASTYHKGCTNGDWAMHPADGVTMSAMRGDPATYLWPDQGRSGVDAASILGVLRTRTGGTMPFDMPTSTEWEYACRGGEASFPDEYGSPDEAVTGLYAWSTSNAKTDGVEDQYGAGRTHKVGRKLPNGWGLYDTLGNVYEVVLDYLPASVDLYNNEFAVDPVGVSRSEAKQHETRGGYRQVRGGCYSDRWEYCRPSFVHKTNCAELNSMQQWYGYRIACPIGYAAHTEVERNTPELTFNETTREATIAYRLDGSEPKIVTVDILTNGVSIGAANFAVIGGDVNRIVEPGYRRIYWRPDHTWTGHCVDTSRDNLTVEVREWTTNNPPDYAVLDLSGALPPMYYASAEAVPFSVTNDMYRMSLLVLRKIPAAGVTWRMGHDRVNGLYSESAKTNEVGHLVQLTRDYWMSIFQITQYQYYLVKKTNWSMHQPAFHWRLPVENVAWGVQSDGKESIRGSGTTWPGSHGVNQASFLYKLRALYPTFQFDLPTEAQWEYACRAGTLTPHQNGKTYISSASDVADYSWNSNTWTGDPLLSENATHIVGIKAPNNWGLYDMGGNLLELCLDWYKANILDTVTVGEVAVDPEGPAVPDVANVRVCRGCAFSDSMYYSRSHYRRGIGDTYNSKWYGFRIVAPIVP